MDSCWVMHLQNSLDECQLLQCNLKFLAAVVSIDEHLELMSMDRHENVLKTLLRLVTSKHACIPHACRYSSLSQQLSPGNHC